MQGMRRRQFEQGSINGWMVGTIGFLVLTLIAGAVAAWVVGSRGARVVAGAGSV